MEKVTKSRTSSNKSFVQKVADWLEDSPAKKVMVAGAGALALAISILNGAWTGWKEYRLMAAKPTIEIHSSTSFSLNTPINFEQLIDPTYNPSGEDSKIPMPYFPVTLELINPTDKKVSLSHCGIRIGFYQRTKEYMSDGYLLENETDINPPERYNRRTFLLDVGERKLVKLRFFFLPTPEFKKRLEDKTTQAAVLQASCSDEANEKVQSLSRHW